MKYSNITHSILEKYEVDFYKGFLPKEHPLNVLPPAYKLWDNLNKQLSKAISFTYRSTETWFFNAIMVTDIKKNKGQFFYMKTITEWGHAKGCKVGFDYAHGARTVFYRA